MTSRAIAYRRVLAPWPWLARLRFSQLAVEPAVTICLVAVGLVTHGLNMFHNPAFTFMEDEGIYTEQAWAVLAQHRLAPYTYFYDHAPGGWILMAAWTAVSGGPHTFGTAIDSGRVLMLLLHLAMIPLLFQIARKLGCGIPAAALATLLFSISPLAVFYQRAVLLDSIMVFWLLLGLNLLLDGWGRLSRSVLAGVCFGVAVVTKETAVVLLPAIVFIALQQRWRHQGRFALAGWVVPAAMVASWYLLYALLKGELLPSDYSAAFFSGGDAIHGGESSKVSLVGALVWQLSRSGGGLFSLHNEFWQLVRADWLPRDRLLILGGSAAIGLNLLRGIRDRRALAAGLLGLMPLLYMARGGVVFNYYILFAIPFLCLNLAVLIAPLLARLSAPLVGPLAGLAAMALLGGYLWSGTLQPLYTQKPDEAGREALLWLKEHVAPQSSIIVYDNFWTDLRAAGLDGPAFENVQSHWKVALDPAIRNGVFHNDWHSVDYLLLTPNYQSDFKSSGDTVALDALAHAHLVKRWDSPPGPYVELWRVDQPDQTGSALLSSSDGYIKEHFAQGGAFANPDGAVTSENQAYAMLRAAWLGDQAGFAQTWGWSRVNLLNAEGLLSWSWQDNSVKDNHTAADADTDTALALLMAGRRWNDAGYLDAGKRMTQAIWDHDVATVNGVPYLTAGDWTAAGSPIALNPSYFAPYAYHIFADVDPAHDWRAVIDSSYQVIFGASSATFGANRSAGLPPDWVGIDPVSGQLQALSLSNGDSTQYGYDAARTYWRIALDLRWFNDGRAQAFLGLANFLDQEVKTKGYPSAVYAHTGDIAQPAPSLVGDAGAMSALLTLDPSAGQALYDGQILGNSVRDGAGLHWADSGNLYAEEWGWFAAALYSDALPDLWQGQQP